MSVAAAAGYTWGQCTYYVARSLEWVGGGLGNAKDWLSNAKKLGYATSSTPVPGSVAVWGAGHGADSSFGHVAMVTGVQGNGLPIVSEMNVKGLNVIDARSVDAGSAAGIIGYILPPGSGSSGSEATIGGASQTATLAGNAPATDSGGCKSLGDFVGGGGVLGTIAAPVGFAKWASQPCVWQRSLIVLVSLGVVGVGLLLLFRHQADELGSTLGRDASVTEV